MEEEKLLETLRKNKEAIAWSIKDLKGISPSICMHKIMLEENARTFVKHHRRLNPIIKEVVRKEVLKWLNAGFIYAISNSPWVSPVHEVPKKRGLTPQTFFKWFFSWNLSFRCFKVHHEFIIIFRNYFSI